MPEPLSDARLEAMVEEATLDCYTPEEQVNGLFYRIEDELALPFETTVLGVPVVVEKVLLTDSGQTTVGCRRDHVRQSISILDLPLPTPRPRGAEWIEAYRRWARP